LGGWEELKSKRSLLSLVKISQAAQPLLTVRLAYPLKTLLVSENVSVPTKRTGPSSVNSDILKILGYMAAFFVSLCALIATVNFALRYLEQSP